MRLSNTEKTIGRIHKLESFGLVDGPGVRFIVFMQGCAMRCQYCHNPESWAGGGKEWTAEDLLKRVLGYRPYWKEKGGVTVSGGEPLLQLDFVTEFFGLLHEQGVNTTIDTAGQPFRNDPEYLEKLDKLLEVTDLVMLDIKEWDPVKHKKLTGCDNANILAFAKYVSDKGVKLWIRHVLVPGLTDGEDDMRATGEFIRSLKTVERVEVLPYHTLGMNKWKNMGIEYPLEGYEGPTREQIDKAEELLGATK